MPHELQQAIIEHSYKDLQNNDFQAQEPTWLLFKWVLEPPVGSWAAKKILTEKNSKEEKKKTKTLAGHILILRTVGLIKELFAENKVFAIGSLNNSEEGAAFVMTSVNG